jgi:hypothetical protein
MGCKYEGREHAEAASCGGAMAGVPGTRCYVILGHQTRHDGVEQVQELTVSHLERSAASGESPRRQVTVGGGEFER